MVSRKTIETYIFCERSVDYAKGLDRNSLDDILFYSTREAHTSEVN